MSLESSPYFPLNISFNSKDGCVERGGAVFLEDGGEGVEYVVAEGGVGAAP